MLSEPVSTLCPRCNALMLADGTVCWPCTHTAVLDLGTVADWGNELVIALSRQTRIGRGEGPAVGGRDENPLPIDLRASDLHSELHRTLTAWTERARHALELWLPRPAWPLCKDALTTWCEHDSCRAIVNDPQKAPLSLADMARLLAEHPRWIRRQDNAPALLDVLARAAARMVPALDLPPDMIGLGPCDSDGCEEVIKAERGQASAACRGCSAVYNVERRREARLRRADGLRATPGVLAALLTDIYAPEHGIELKANTITTWDVRDRKLARRGTTPSGRAKYRVGDVRTLYLAMIQRELKARARKAAAAEKTKAIATDQKETRAA